MLISKTRKNSVGVSRRRSRHDHAQITLEFIFSMMVVLVMIYSLIMVLRWSGVDLAERRLAHDQYLTVDVNQNYGNKNINDGPLKQLEPSFYEPMGLKATFSPGN